jgi:hypothetical protein
MEVAALNSADDVTYLIDRGELLRIRNLRLLTSEYSVKRS